MNASLITGLKYPWSLALDGNGHLYVGDFGAAGYAVGKGQSVNIRLTACGQRYANHGIDRRVFPGRGPMAVPPSVS